MLALVMDTLSRQNKLHCVNKLNVFTLTYGPPDTLSEDAVVAKRFVEYVNEKYSVTLDHSVIAVNDTKHIERALPDAIYAAETFDTALVQNAILQFLLCTYIKQKKENVKVLFCGDFLTDIFGKVFDSEAEAAQSEAEAAQSALREHKEGINSLHKKIACLDKVTCFHNMQLRLPFVNKALATFFLQMHPMHRKKLHFNLDAPKIDKYVLRKAFEQDNLLPDFVLWRQSHSSRLVNETLWTQMADFFERQCSDSTLDRYINTFGSQKYTKESIVYHQLFHEVLGKKYLK
jgi:asparagine synthase (glutamine-hydrolysing)